MKWKDRDAKWQSFLKSLRNFILFFSMVAFVVTCCMLLFVTNMSAEMGITLTEMDVQKAAKLTLGNTLLISVLFAHIDWVRRKLMVDRPVKRITDAAEKIMQGDFSTRIKPFKSAGGMDGFNAIIDCFNRMTEELSSTETLRTDFIANVSHELKTPLAVIQNYGTMLQKPGLSEEQRLEYAKSITDASRRLASLVTNILKLNKLENQQIFPSVAEYDLGEQLCECLLQFEHEWEKRNIDIETEIAENVTVNADTELLSLVWNNLLSNAFKFTGDGGKVALTLTADENYAIVKVSDTGCGIKPEVGAHIFEKFYQGDTSHSTRGNGLGLALVKRVVDIMRGEISVESVYGSGSTFTVKIRRA
ncbi:MAG: HAMP domain-containing histidine kinase [Lachnospiraceae bacterium]|nr:HAMP domain-containing histidine kinase [Lachnospiraceae bacterium]